MPRALFVAAFAFAFLSSSMAQAYGLAAFRVVAFSAVVALLALAGVLAHPRFSARGRDVPMLLLLLLLLLLLTNLARPFDPLDYKILLVLIAMLAAPNIAAALRETDLPRLVLLLLAFYLLASLLLLDLRDPGAVVRGIGGVLRVDVSGSLVTHSSLSLLALLLFVTRMRTSGRVLERGLLAAMAVLAAAYLFLAATRTTLVAFLLWLVLDLATRPRGTRWRGFLRLALPAVLLFVLFTRLVSDALWLRLTSAVGGDYSSGRLHSLAYWLGAALDRPFGLGMGAVRQIMAEGRPWLDGQRLLEWPHNEFLRFFVEGGWIGLAMVLIMVVWLTREAMFVARTTADPLARTLALALAADLIAQSLLQNYFNTVYQATVAVLLLCMLAERERGRHVPFSPASALASAAAAR